MLARLRILRERVPFIKNLLLIGPLRVKRKSKTKPRILVFIHSAHLNSTSNSLLGCDKIDPLTNYIDDKYEVIKFIIPLQLKKTFNSSYVPLNNLYLLFALRKSFMREKSNRTTSFLLYRYLIKKFTPFCILTIGTHHDLILACREKSIANIEVQHGWISPDYLEYSYQNLDSPDYFLAWSDHYASLFESPTSRNAPKSIAVGLPGIYNETSLYPINRNGSEILFALSNELSDSIDPYGCINQKDFEFLLALMENFSDITIRLRCHPVLVSRFGFSSIESWLREFFPNINISNPHNVSTGSDLEKAKILVGPATSLAIEAAGVGVPSLLRLTYNANYNYGGRLSDDSLSYIDPGLLDNRYIHLDSEYSIDSMKTILRSSQFIPPWEHLKSPTYIQNFLGFLSGLIESR